MSQHRNITGNIHGLFSVACLTAVIACAISPARGLDWTTEIVDGASSTGMYSSLAVDSAGLPHVAYYDLTNTSLKYAVYNGTSWSVSTVDNSGYMGRYASLALDAAGNPHIAYCNEGSMSSPTSNPALRYAYHNGTSWVTHTVDTSTAFRIIGRYNSIAVDSTGRPHISYHDTYNMDLKYAHYDGSTWTNTLVDGASDDVGIYTSIALDSSDRPHISYAELASSGGELKYASFNGSSWSSQVLQSNVYADRGTSIALDDSNHPHISWGGQTTKGKGLQYTAYNGASWSTQLVDSGSYVGYYSSIALDPSDNPHISHLEQNYRVKYTAYDGSSWSTEVIEGATNGTTSLALDASGDVHISYQSTYLKYAHGTPEPATIALLLFGIPAFLWRRSRRSIR